ncbi:hypothetical protein [Kitasatospora kifunensis]|uniref:Uncharacterized protein n=1 Tax=Kitasatospora kifunensis TaxID=58351 RepID=A0A7W7VU22_KITKI|nr:hypothetical protein [Kitasatospora kifunensis]MBB4922214.1 hypothetical protein [Kitasatospora kifunensis]
MIYISDNFTRDDIGQMRKDGDLRAFMRSQFRRPEANGEDQVPKTAPPKSRPDGRPVGAWPAGCGRPSDPIPYQGVGS